MGATTAKNISNMNIPYATHSSILHPHHNIEFASCVDSSNPFPKFVLEIPNYSKNGQILHISIHFHHYTPLMKCTSGLRLVILNDFLVLII